ncbi:rhodanese-like domain-containing protein [Leuconostoc carnosum]|uniref:rhodanese-like domain-containing protein n=1 Tax=Leuconostoc TaxID=1243 RepID=UPI000D51BC5E|nr:MULTISPECIES: rhodanese-like domain-containing protein [Leuconostoc]KAA8325629.1 rhodanese-like domain-containing protein [Leuconostoc carnosum]KAA8359850.1 rhodanese-like domain-containing protein [Leuconostoc carnosum]KAA8365426.1 rhodanese-like domain-containing protein [Leuconostoc carnosum]KAA8367795.1 rhodanese-like domain-containing protein [Leuconostoc carnosum]KAA8372988.1 rhodanese-like domain-containing protein [Leuconostoc carnosum]
MNLLVSVILVIVLWILFAGGSWLWIFLTAKKTGNLVKADEFAKRITEENGQIVDVRELSAYKRSHIMGARSIPSVNFTQGKSGLRKDRDIFLYDDRLKEVTRASKSLKKQGYDKNKIFILRGGYNQYQGKTTK